MDYLQNHCWCSQSNWDAQDYQCRHVVTLLSYSENYIGDWNSVIFTDETDTPNLKPEVIDWLNQHVEDSSKPYCGNTTVKAWCIGSSEYRKTDSCSSFSIFFQRRKDAMAFIKRWSKWKKPLHYWQYFTDVRKALDVTTGKYTNV